MAVAPPLFLFAPGAGAPSTSAWMHGWKDRLASLGSVVTFDYPYMLGGRRAPDPQARLIEAHRAALDAAREGHTGKVVLAGKSMGSRIGCHVSLEANVSGLVCFGYPLKGASQRGSLRDQVLLALRTPVLFVQGTRDPLCPLDLLADVRSRMTAPSRLLVIEGGDHSLAVTRTMLRAAGETQSDVDRRILTEIGEFLGGL
jgi:predicted alpha/beta-hydrolase family hydrolase